MRWPCSRLDFIYWISSPAPRTLRRRPWICRWLHVDRSLGLAGQHGAGDERRCACSDARADLGEQGDRSWRFCQFADLAAGIALGALWYRDCFSRVFDSDAYVKCLMDGQPVLRLDIRKNAGFHTRGAAKIDGACGCIRIGGIRRHGADDRSDWHGIAVVYATISACRMLAQVLDATCRCGVRCIGDPRIATCRRVLPAAIHYIPGALKLWVLNNWPICATN